MFGFGRQSWLTTRLQLMQTMTTIKDGAIWTRILSACFPNRHLTRLNCCDCFLQLTSSVINIGTGTRFPDIYAWHRQLLQTLIDQQHQNSWMHTHKQNKYKTFVTYKGFIVQVGMAYLDFGLDVKTF